MKELSIWKSKEYYTKAKEGSMDYSHPGMKILQKYIDGKVSKILDIGCGEGTRLARLINKNITKKGYGIDISNTAILMAKKNYPYLKFLKSDIGNISFNNDTFDLCYSAYVLEHLENPERLLKEAKRLLKLNGVLVLIAPNYGSPNRSSPCYKSSRIKKLIFGYINDLLRIFSKTNKLDWNKVIPISSKKKYEIDWDCQTEPYLGSLVNYLKKNNFNILEYSSCWGEESGRSSFVQKVSYLLSRINIFPFYYWGPHFVVVARKIG